MLHMYICIYIYINQLGHFILGYVIINSKEVTYIYIVKKIEYK